jgi:aspartokinase-like uncharacterized kinase
MLLEVVKVGGSLFGWTDFPPALRSCLEARIDRFGVLIAGGGECADVVRSWSNRFQLADGAAHWLALRAMGLQSRLLAHLLSIPHAESLAECQDHWQTRRCWVALDPFGELQADVARNPSEALPESWEVTSDAVAAWVATKLNAARIVLLKSVGGEAPIDGSEAVASGWIDPWFCRIAAGMDVEWVNLRQRLRAPVQL